MPYDKALPTWNKTGIAPTQTKMDNGWAAQEHPPASLFNWFFNTTFLALQELQQEAINNDQKGVNNGVATLDASGDLPIGQADNILNWVKGFGLGDTAKDVSNTDLNIIDGTGFYKGENLTNGPAPAALSLYYMIVHLKHSSTNKVQVAIRYGTGSTAGQIWQRSYINGTWGSWIQLAVYDANGKVAIANLPAATTALAGIAQLVDSISSTSTTGAATANSVKLLADWIKSYGIGDVAKDVSSTDLNALDATGIYKGATLTNGPLAAAASTFFFIIHTKHDASHKSQIAIRFGTGSGAGQIWQRINLAGTWQSWQQLAMYDVNGKVAVGNLPAATTTAAGIVQLIDSLASASTTGAATANSVKMLQDWIKGYGLGTIAKNIASTDLNALAAENGFYKGNGLTNAPGEGTGFFHIINLAHSSTFTVQIAVEYGSGTTGAGRVWTRQNNAGTWSAWEQQATVASAAADAQAKVNTHANRTDNPHNVTSKQINEYTPAVDGTASGELIPVGLTYGSLPNSATGYPGAFGTIMNIRYNQFRTVQYWFDTGNGVSNNNKPQYRYWYNNAWNSWNEFETTAGAQAKVNATQVLKLTNDDGVSFSFSGDVDSLKTAGVYYITGSATNRPLGGLTGLCIVTQLVSSNGWHQIFYAQNRAAYRYYTSGAWGAWIEMASQDWVKSFGIGGPLNNQAANDPNALVDSGNYYFTSAAPNLPEATFAFYITHVGYDAGATAGYQIAIKSSTNQEMYFRRKVGSIWQAWSGPVMKGDSATIIDTLNFKVSGDGDARAVIKTISDGDTATNNGFGLAITGGGTTIIGGGESAHTLLADASIPNGSAEKMYVTSDSDIIFKSNMQNGVSSSKDMTYTAAGILNIPNNPYEGVAIATNPTTTANTDTLVPFAFTTAGQYTIPEDGVYAIWASIAVSIAANSTGTLKLFKNGTYIHAVDIKNNGTAASQFVTLSGLNIGSHVKGDVLKFYINSTAVWTITGGSSRGQVVKLS